MTDDKILEVLERYKLLAERDRTGMVEEYVDERKLIIRMVSDMQQFLEQGRREKVFRWLGFIQGMWYMMGIFTIEQMAEHNKP